MLYQKINMKFKTAIVINLIIVVICVAASVYAAGDTTVYKWSDIYYVQSEDYSWRYDNGKWVHISDEVYRKAKLNHEKKQPLNRWAMKTEPIPSSVDVEYSLKNETVATDRQQRVYSETEINNLLHQKWNQIENSTKFLHSLPKTQAYIRVLWELKADPMMALSIDNGGGLPSDSMYKILVQEARGQWADARFNELTVFYTEQVQKTETDKIVNQPIKPNKQFYTEQVQKTETVKIVNQPIKQNKQLVDEPNYEKNWLIMLGYAVSMLGYAVMFVPAFICAKYISTNWSGVLKLTFGHFIAFMLSWLLGGIIALLVTSLFAEIAKNAVPVFFARGFWWALIGMFFGMYKAKKGKNNIALRGTGSMFGGSKESDTSISKSSEKIEEPHQILGVQMKLLNMSDFQIEAGMQVLNGSRDMSAYDGKPFQCACGKTHDFQSWMDFRNFVTTGVNAKIMVECPYNSNVTTIIKTKNKFLFIFDRFESVAGYLGE